MSPLETSGVGAKKHLFNQPVLNMEITATEISERGLERNWDLDF